MDRAFACVAACRKSEKIVFSLCTRQNCVVSMLLKEGKHGEVETPCNNPFKNCFVVRQIFLEDTIMTLFERTNTFPTLAGMRGISRLHDDIDRLFGGFLAREPWPDFSARDDMALLPQIDFKSATRPMCRKGATAPSCAV